MRKIFMNKRKPMIFDKFVDKRDFLSEQDFKGKSSFSTFGSDFESNHLFGLFWSQGIILFFLRN